MAAWFSLKVVISIGPGMKDEAEAIRFDMLVGPVIPLLRIKRP